MDEAECIGECLPNYIVLKVPQEDQHYWSPQLSLMLEPMEKGTIIRGLYGPKPSIWTMFIFAYAVLGVGAMFVGIIGFARLNLNMPAPILWLLLVIAILALLVYLTAQVGQKKGAEQTFRIHHFYEKVVGNKVKVH